MDKVYVNTVTVVNMKYFINALTSNIKSGTIGDTLN